MISLELMITQGSADYATITRMHNNLFLFKHQLNTGYQLDFESSGFESKRAQHPEGTENPIKINTTKQHSTSSSFRKYGNITVQPTHLGYT